MNTPPADNSSHPMSERALVLRNSAISIVLLSITSTIPLLGIFAGLFMPFPILHTIFHHGWRGGFVVGALSALFLVAFHPPLAIMYSMETFIPSLILILFLRLACHPMASTVYSTLITGITLFVLYIPFVAVRGEDPLWQLLEATRAAIEQGASGSGLAQNVELIMHVAYNIAFGFFMTGVFFSLICSLGLIMRRGADGKHIGVLGSYFSAKIPPYFLILLLAGLTGMAAQHHIVFMGAASLLFFLTILYALQGFLTMSFFFRHRKTPLFFQVLVYGIIILQPGLALMIAFLGILETLLGLREKMMQGRPSR
ncbi:YybS family protein [Desulfurispirillum indicum]|uniref:DUF2232 domain-containing protein n=1 Tax=Desulfurispirillum indicum (strain ATCC BAA-1389 / DSM 22839 / S5) TaxID=653733 RepID=E6W2S4_DESIS|nr:DUF2232 domain-containing protein [Desulfurispirillum indicum]ADU65658.1 Protein of unknown function DUF2232, membrane [Desulfurispirillum indicum S5]UCZ57508.1 YybS family protein [Desulfurispirillum indicum]